MPTVVFSFLTPQDVRGKEFARAFFESVRTDLDGRSLGRYGATEPLRHRFDEETDTAIELWYENLFWTQRKIGASGSVIHGSKKRHANIHLCFDFVERETNRWIEFLRSVSEQFQVDFSLIYCFEGQSAGEEDEVFEEITSHDIQDALPTLPWACCFGSPYIAMIGPQKLESAAFFDSQMLGDNLLYCQLTESPTDYIDDYPKFHEQQIQVKNTLGNEYFLSCSQPIAPTFRFSFREGDSS